MGDSIFVSAGGFASGRSARRLTLRRVRQICPWKVFELGKEYREQDRVTDLTLKKDGTVTGTILGTDTGYADDAMGETFLQYLVGPPERECRATVSLRTGGWNCSCSYSRVAICSHVVALLICAARDLGVTVSAGDLPKHDRPGERTLDVYRDDANKILAQATNAESAVASLDKYLELADACYREGDVVEALMVCLGISEALLTGLDYGAYSGHFTVWGMPMMNIPPSTREPKDMDAMRVKKFSDVMEDASRVLSYSRILHEQKIPCIVTLHRLCLETNPWGPYMLYSLILSSITRTDRDNKFLKTLHDPVIPKHTPNPKEDPIGFETVMNLVDIQAKYHDNLQDDSLLDHYAKHYRDNIGTCVRYVKCLSYAKYRNTDAVKAEARRLFPDFDAWVSPFRVRPA